ncbi:polysaccharide pyruvyl transferase family protein [Massilia sp. GCM10020059]|uniref:Polysaccharide pyruvyl transferase family protein n=1 Tax=Massilia agrisoli TaxID=2892444 RepID=A0ABS8ITV8_9BURK|nr:polysaccharide pyruvyl transferase family protein [Massilia agrisoli]MCC6071283.1 polysaccharide pyruvyl transferase family protein [Massilia agrisoli]
MTNHKRPVVGVFGTNGTLSRALSQPQTSLKLAGDNTGNLVYQYAADLNITDPKLYFSQAESNDLDVIKDSIDVLHIPAANQLNPNFDLAGWAHIVNYIAKPVFIAGLGLQCELSEDEIVLTEGTVRFIDALKRHAPLIGVRGRATQRLLERHGVENVVVTGCPSNFINRSIDGSTISAALARAADLTHPKVDFYPGTLSNHRSTEAKLRDLVSGFDCRYVLQTNPNLFNFIDGDRDNQKTLDYLAWERAALSPSMSQQDYNDCYSKNGSYYFSAAAWIDSASRRDLGIGMRMHGVVATIQGGGAGVCVVSDGRIQELVNTMAYPHVSLDDVNTATSLREVLDKVKFNAARYDAQRSSLFELYRRAAMACGVAVNERWS